MDLGATVCLARAPLCLLCPVQRHCAARRAGTQERFPVKTRKLKRGKRDNAWLWLTWGDKLWLCQRPDSGVWAGLWSLPEYDSPQALEAASAAWPGTGSVLPSFTHVLTHLDWTLHPLRWALPARTPQKQAAAITGTLPTGAWFAREEALAMGLPAPLRKLLLRTAT
jgi:A/G-specific adenine glycosylase